MKRLALLIGVLMVITGCSGGGDDVTTLASPSPRASTSASPEATTTSAVPSPASSSSPTSPVPPPATSTAARSGLKGHVLAGPTCPVETVDDPCPDKPVASAKVTARNNRTTHTATSDKDGAYRIELPPGFYEVNTKAEGTFSCADAVTEVKRGRFTNLDISCDTGIR